MSRRFESIWVLCLFGACAMFGCQSQQGNSQELRVEPFSARVFANRHFGLQVHLTKNGAPVAFAPNEISFEARLGKVVDGVYCAPAESGEEVLAISHTPSKSRVEVRFPVLPEPRLEIKAERTLVQCEEKLPVAAAVMVGELREDVDPKDFEYRAARGRFEGGLYVAPREEGEDTIFVSCPRMKLEASLRVQASVNAVLSASLPQSLASGGTASLEVCFKKREQKLSVPAGELEISAEKGSFREGLYVAPAQGGTDRITVKHRPTGQVVRIEVAVVPWRLEVQGPEGKLTHAETAPIQPTLYRDRQAVKAEAREFRFAASRGQFEGNVYRAPETDGPDTITVEHIASGAKAACAVSVEYTPYRMLETERFRMPIPSGWKVEKTDIGFSAEGPRASAYSNCSIMATVLPGFDFLDIATMRLFFQQQIDSNNENVEESSEDEIQVSGVSGLRITFENYSGLAEKSWWVFLKEEGAAYILGLQGNRNFFKEEVPLYLLEHFEFKKLARNAQADFKIPSSMKELSQKAFSISLPEKWKVHNVSGGFLGGVSRANEGIAAVSDVHRDGRAMILFMLAHKQQEVRNFDLSLLLVLLRQMIKDAAIKEEMEVQDLQLKHGLAKLLQIEGAEEIPHRTWLIATKHETTAYGILFRGPLEIWDANSELPNRILQSFVPKE